MQEALCEAAIAASLGEIPVGSVVVHKGEIIARTHNSNRTMHDPTLHAEMEAIRAATRVLSNERLCGCSLYVTKEPCAMCAGAIIHSRIERVFIGTRDTKYGACGTVFKILGNTSFNHIPTIEFGLLEKEAAEMLSSFFTSLRNRE